MDLLILVGSFTICLLGTMISLGHGLSCLLLVGYFYGIIKANYLGLYTTFMFDAGMLGVYIIVYTSEEYQKPLKQFWKSTGGKIIQFMIMWPIILACLPIHHYLVQLVALRNDVWSVFMIPIGFIITGTDLRILARAFGILNMIAFIFGYLEFVQGVERFYPINSATQIIYASNDIITSQGRAFRIPGTFSHAHQYAGTMIGSIPYLLNTLFTSRVKSFDKILSVAGICTAMGGILLTGTRSPIAFLVIIVITLWVLNGFNVKLGVAIGLLGVVMLVVIASDEQFSRLSTLLDTVEVGDRIYGSVNEGFFTLFYQYPIGAGLAQGCPSIPQFLLMYAPEQIGLENEYCRILLGQGWIGLAIWFTIYGYIFSKPPVVKFTEPRGVLIQMLFASTIIGSMVSALGVAGFSMIPGGAMVCWTFGMLMRYRILSEKK